MNIGHVGQKHKKDTPTVTMEFDLEDLYWLQAHVGRDGFGTRDCQDGINLIEEYLERQAN